MRAFIFSLDSFVAFTLALVAIYSLIFFSSIPSSYYYLLTQAHFLAKDALFSISTSDCDSSILVCKISEGSVLDNIVFGEQSYRNDTIANSVGKAVPSQFGYVFEVSDDNGKSWSVYYDTSLNPKDSHAKKMKKLSVSSQIPVFEYSASTKKEINPFLYTSCMGDDTDFVITCQTPPVSEEDIVPKAGVKLVKLTIFI